MSEEVEKKLEPELRFPEFRDAGGWKEKPFSQLFKVGSGKDYKHLSSGDVPVYGSGGYMLSVSDYLYDGESVGIGRKGTIDNPLFLSGKFWTVDTLFYTHSFKDCLPKFVYAIFQNINWLNYNEAGGIPSLSKTIIDKIEVLVPNLDEQKEIVNCLSSIDELITVQSRKLEALKAHKKGLLQHLFPAEGETVPKLRFPEFRHAGKWEEKPLGEFLSQHPDYGINAPAVPYSEELPTYLRITDISEDGYFLRDQKVSVAKEVTAKNYLNEGDIALARTGASVGKSYRYGKEDGKLVFAGFLIRVKPDEQRLRSEFLFHFLSTEQYWRWVAFTSARSGQPGINGNEYSTLPLPLPPSVVEQQKISNCLSSVDELIVVQSHKIDTLKSHKKGLMQKLFPSPEGV